MTRFALAVLIATLPIAAADPDDAKAILARTAAAYQDALDYEFTVESKVTSQPGDDPATRRQFHLAARRPRSLYTDERVLAPQSYRVRLATDGDTTWAYSPTTHKFVDNGGKELRQQLTDQHYQLFGRFADLDRLDLIAEIEKRGPTVRISIRPRSDEHWQETLSIDSRTGIVQESVFRRRTPVEVTTTVTRWRNVQINHDVSVSFSPEHPAGATPTNQIAIP